MSYDQVPLRDDQSNKNVQKSYKNMWKLMKVWFYLVSALLCTLEMLPPLMESPILTFSLLTTKFWGKYLAPCSSQYLKIGTYDDNQLLIFYYFNDTLKNWYIYEIAVS